MTTTTEPAPSHAGPHGAAPGGQDWHADPESHLAHHFDDPQQQFDSGKLGIWVFLVTEVLFFSGLFCAYAIYRSQHPEIFVQASQYLDTFWGAFNTVVLILSSLTAAWAVRCAQLGNKKGLIFNIVVTIACAAGFMVVKYVEYSHKIHVGLTPGGTFTFDYRIPDAPPASPGEVVFPEETRVQNLHIFFSIYFGMTGLHGFHVLAGIVVWVWLLLRAIKGEFGPKFFGPIDFAALYWHIVDVIWIYLFPLLYLIN